MGEATDKVDSAVSEEKVIALREQIANKRSHLSAELEELRRRRANAIVEGKRLAQVAGIAAVGLLVSVSLTKAVLDIFRKEDDTPEQHEGTRPKHEGGLNQSTILGLGYMSIRWLAREYIKYKLEEARLRMQKRLDRLDEVNGHHEVIATGEHHP